MSRSGPAIGYEGGGRLFGRHLLRFMRGQLRFILRGGHWWIPLSILFLGIAIALSATAQVVVPHAVYVLF